MEPAFKRPRLTLYGHSTDEELERARSLNDLSLKSRFEQIFEKYSRDFTGLADEIDLQGAIKINNGHVKKMRHETDIGVVTQRESTSDGTNGRSILRAMTVDPQGGAAQLERFLPDEALPSIEETNQQTADLSEEDSAAQSEDDLFGSSRRPLKDDWRDSVDTSLDQEVSEALADDTMSDVSDRTPSPDFLLQENIPLPPVVIRPNSRPASQVVAQGPFEAGTLVHDTSDDAILQHFGPAVGKEVLDVIGKRTEARQAHIEPAWRIPVDPRALKPINTLASIVDHPADTCSESSGPAVSVWQPTKPPDQALPSLDNPRSTLPSQDDDSDDPLQDLVVVRAKRAVTDRKAAATRGQSRATSKKSTFSAKEICSESPVVERPAPPPAKRDRGRPRKATKLGPPEQDKTKAVAARATSGPEPAIPMGVSHGHPEDKEGIKVEEPDDHILLD